MTQTVMLIDDSRVVRMHLARALHEAGYAVVEAEDGLDAIQKLETEPRISLIVCDVNMPRMDGLEFVKWLSGQATPPPVVMLTTEGHPHQIQRAKEHGARGWMVKPMKPEVLVAAARRLIRAA